MTKRFFDTIPGSLITPEPIYHGRREWLKSLALSPLLIAGCKAESTAGTQAPIMPDAAPLQARRPSAWDTRDEQTSWHDATHHNNFYEFGTGKGDPSRHSARFKPRPWSVEVAGLAEVTGTFDLDDLVKPELLEERIYRLRCVEAWSMVIPWVGVPLADCLKRFKPLSSAKYVAFTTVMRPAEMPGQSYPVLDWPYREGLRIDEAMHPLTLLAVGMYGRVLPNQNGAPLRLVVPWKYGFKSIKSIVRIEFVAEQPVTSWNAAGPDEYGFYSNVNPQLDHPRWSQRTERRIAGSGGSLFGNRIETLPFNGYGEHVASLYTDADARKYF
ncbi:protein-methionine-sulfoxide reductase catalytic subunit MsrP [Tahibacter amnicola]|uniref:Protein-methionine-sulfoxide reductase catalytic subunit MsrP n=1 Tax=Tahibacter amnicola TaxID=2976241 RepID=A0ABY6BFL0_9GAMM|nr:protein-methionine-sulfoxide reductase catalytic subunit MsrP [Tahibacter amnicola]UXI66657.1 protein-methionine-sulfoxide reductase catalytic subunit MsrP [Tahibacter amnicola]